MATLVSVNVGKPRDVDWQGRTVHTGAWKEPVAGRRMVRRLNVDGDGQGDLAGHGGEQRAVLVYQTASYRYWEEHLKRDLEFGDFGENFTVDGLPDDEVCIGDRYRIGEAEFEVTQPRVTCYRVGLRLGEPKMAALLVAHHRPGFYLRVIAEGHVKEGDEIVRTRTGPGALSVADTDALLYLPDPDPDRLRTALAVPALSPGWRQSFREMTERKPPEAAAEAGAADTGWPGFKALRVTRMVPETPGVCSVHLAPADGTALPVARAGQYLSVRITDGPAPPPVRSYSLSSAPGADGYRISVKREPHGRVSGYVHTALKPGAVIDIAGPRGDFVLADGTEPVLLISAGIGVTPVLAMLHQLAAAHSTRQVWWIHTARDRAQHAFAEEAHALLAALPDAREHTFYTGPALAGAPHDPAVVLGRLTAQALSALTVPTGADAYVCGPDAFMTDIRAALEGAGVSPERVHSELFGARERITPGIAGASDARPHQPPGAPGTGPLITFTRSGLATPWSPGYGSVLELAEACDVPTRWSCRTGVCHTCVTPLIAGDVAYDPAPLEPPEPGSVLICCSRPATDMFLDL
ncbi:MOSC and FAD-binding oxidoreductase domain-containing protein [Streptomyces sp. V4-01]|uniref:MOSC and FAD-binding oxidoreductase domain-containing protein n=1 Tax=Actinacidiphila polyblastidii TaxID=3110430 RepID=A0ABU7PH31_9ACTN|nr:MOSC and FAD-binding oxidoreductase domain-containing protein [Streptomyces sp. V4-01]